MRKLRALIIAATTVAIVSGGAQRWILLAATVVVPSRPSLEAQFAPRQPSKQLTAMCLAATDRFAVVDQCAKVWLDSLHASDRPHVLNSLAEIGGRVAVDALLADYQRSQKKDAQLAAINAMATTGSADDVAFLIRQLRGPLVTRDDSLAITAAARTLGVLQAKSARDSLRAAQRRFGQNNAIASAIAGAIAKMDEPPCSDTTSGGTVTELVRVALQCSAPYLNTGLRYPDRMSDSTWLFMKGSWRLTQSTATERAGKKVRSAEPAVGGVPWVRTSARIRSDGRHAVVSVQMWCGGRCGEGWSYELYLSGRTWRVLSARMTMQS